jgi:acyl-coenzyme A thioesterase PaaI-like protein
MFLARGKCGPFRFTGEVIRGAGRTIAVRTQGYDEGAEGKLITTASHVFEIVD